MSGPAWLDCPECGADAIESDAKGRFGEDMPEVKCPGCGERLVVRVYEEGFDEDENEVFTVVAALASDYE